MTTEAPAPPRARPSSTPKAGGSRRKRGQAKASKPRRKKRSTAKARRSEARLSEARESFAQALEQLRSEEDFRKWLDAQRRLYHYSPRNILWILFQNPDATYVASYKRWKEELGYQVRRGEESLKVWVPGKRKVTETDPETGEEVEERRTFFMLGSVFDRSQVDPIPGEAKPLAPPPAAAISGDSHAWAIAGLESYAAKLGFEVRRITLPGSKDGFCDYDGRVIGVDQGLAPNGQVRVLSHEDAHALGIDYETFGRRRAEAIVDCAAHIVCARIGLDVSAATVPYVAGWVKDDEEVIARDAGEIDRVAQAILRGADLERKDDEAPGPG